MNDNKSIKAVQLNQICTCECHKYSEKHYVRHCWSPCCKNMHVCDIPTKYMHDDGALDIKAYSKVLESNELASINDSNLSDKLTLVHQFDCEVSGKYYDKRNKNIPRYDTDWNLLLNVLQVCYQSDKWVDFDDKNKLNLALYEDDSLTAFEIIYLFIYKFSQTDDE